MLGQLDEPEIREVLQSQVIGRIGCHAEGATYVVPITYAYEAGYVYGHSADGRKVRMMRQNPAVCFEVEQVDDLANWRSVIAQGRFEELSGDAAASGMSVLMTRLAPLMTSSTAQPSHGLSPHTTGPGPQPSHRDDTAGREPVIYRIRLDDLTGRFERR